MHIFQLTSLPEKITLVGFAINRAVYLDDVLVNPIVGEEPKEGEPDTRTVVQFNWGYVSDITFNTAKEVLGMLQRFLDEKDAMEPYVEAFQRSIIAILPDDSFEVVIDIRKWFRDASTNSLFHGKHYMLLKDVTERMDKIDPLTKGSVI